MFRKAKVGHSAAGNWARVVGLLLPPQFLLEALLALFGAMKHFATEPVLPLGSGLPGSSGCIMSSNI
eukprot:9991946-Lingulodinium_polyedra.AAC.1